MLTYDEGGMCDIEDDQTIHSMCIATQTKKNQRISSERHVANTTVCSVFRE